MIRLHDTYRSARFSHTIMNSATPGSCAAQQSKRCGGFTLIEMIITIVVVGILAGLAAMIILQGVKVYSTEDLRSSAQYQARIGMERMMREMRLVRSTGDVTSVLTDRTQFVYNTINNASIGFRLSGGQIQRSQDGGATWQLLASGITAPGGNLFTYLDNTGASTTTKANLWLVQIQFTATQATESVTLLSTVHPMNF
jgi:prepilin-type N-terminal cleavage/methylation domain-containing protein